MWEFSLCVYLTKIKLYCLDARQFVYSHYFISNTDESEMLKFPKNTKKVGTFIEFMFPFELLFVLTKIMTIKISRNGISCLVFRKSTRKYSFHLV